VRRRWREHRGNHPQCERHDARPRHGGSDDPIVMTERSPSASVNADAVQFIAFAIDVNQLRDALEFGIRGQRA